MPWLIYLVHFIAAALLTNGIPHFINGVSGRPFRTPLVRFSNGKLSSPQINVFWGWLNFLAAFLLFVNFGPLFIGTPIDTLFVAGGMLVAGLLLAGIFQGDAA
jgi:hypothetical protein